jgi:hypothetical protein
MSPVSAKPGTAEAQHPSHLSPLSPMSLIFKKILEKFILPPSTWLPILQFFLSDFALKPGTSGTVGKYLKLMGF